MTSIKRPNPSNILRRVATRWWGQVDQTYSHAPGIATHCTPSHGGLAALVPERMSDQLRAAVGDTIEQVVLYPARWRYNRATGQIVKVTRWGAVFSSESYHGYDSFAQLRDELLGRSEHAFCVDVLVGEEDCEWAVVLAALDAAGVKANWDKGYGPDNQLGRDKRVAQAIHCMARWNVDKLNAIIDAVDDSVEGQTWKLFAQLHRDSALAEVQV